MNSTLGRMARRQRGAIAACVIGLLLAALVAPFINAAPFSDRIQTALEAMLGRRVTFQEAHFTLFNGPGFSLSNVTIGEDPRFGAEPLAFVPTLDARIRLDRFLLGRIVVSSIRLVEPSVNLARRDDGSWNVVELVSRLSRPSRGSLNLFPAVRITEGRVNFKLGVRKTNIYLTDADLSMYREESGKLFLQFSGAPARTDRAGNGFGHMSGQVNWYLHPASEQANQLEGDLTLDRSNLSELSTLFQGEDAGVHGMVSGRARIAGPASALHVAGEMRLEDIHRWDLLPSSGENWRVPYDGVINLTARSVDLKTIPVDRQQPAVQLAVKGTDVLSRPVWSLLANLNSAPVAGLLPLARRMGLGLPDEVKADGKISGAVGYSRDAGWTGGAAISDFTLSVPHANPFKADIVAARIEPERIHLETARLTSGEHGWLDVRGDYSRVEKSLTVALAMNEYPVQDLRNMFGEWLQVPEPLLSLRTGELTGILNYAQSVAAGAASRADSQWNGKFTFDAAEVAIEGLPDAITNAGGQVSFDPDALDVEHFSGRFDKHAFAASFHGTPSGHKPNRVHLEWNGVDLADLEKLLLPGTREGWLARLGLTRQTKPDWMSSRNLQGDLALANVTLNGSALGSVRTRVRWLGPAIELSGLRVQMPQGSIEGSGAISLTGSAPRYQLTASLASYPWRGGFLSAEGRLDSSGTGSDLLLHASAEGRFSGQDLTFSPDNAFRAVSGAFQLSFADHWPDLRLSNLEATDGDEEWTGAAASQSDGKLVLDLQHAGKQRHVVSTLFPDTAPALSSTTASSRSF